MTWAEEVAVEQIRFLLCVHNHQPVGNFDHVIEDAYQRAYLPFLDVLEEHPEVPWALHNSGCLWEWLEKHHPEYIDRIGRGVDRRQIELLAGGFYEPVLPALTQADRRGQVEKMRAYLDRRFGADARGLWLTERVWEPDLPIDLAAAGITYLPIDDTQLHQVGIAPERVRGGFMTESGGQALRIFPALMSLRYKIPYAEPDEVVRFLRDPFPGGGSGLALYADDGEKFGIWPGSHKLVYKEKWLHRFLTALQESAERVTLTTFAREMELDAPLGLVYLPTGSYAEMGEWSLPPDHQESYLAVREKLTAGGQKEEADLFVRGGFWRSFFARYPESNWMHMRTLEASVRCRAFRKALPAASWEQARDHLWRAQCNCAYWHGVFGGLYLPHLRHGIYGELIRGETLLARSLHGRGPYVAAREADLDVDGHHELLLENDAEALFFDPDRGGRLVEWDDRSAAMNLINVLSRRPEHYHRQLEEETAAQVAGESEEVGEEPAGVGGETAAAATIHAGIRAKESGLRDLLSYDWYDRACLTDRFFDEPPEPLRLSRGELHEVGDFVDQPFNRELIEERDEIALRMWRVGGLWRGGNRQRLSVEKTVRLRAGQRGFTVAYRYRNLSDAPLTAWAAVENHLNLLAGNARDRFLVVDGRKARPAILGAPGEARGIGWFALVNDWQAWHIRITLDRPVDFCRYPVRTVSLSEAGAESNFQGLALLCVLRLELAVQAETTLGLTCAVHDGRPEIESRAGRTKRPGASRPREGAGHRRGRAGVARAEG
jgi:alpha-amylase